MRLVRNPRDFAAGLLMLAFGALFAWSSLQSNLGSLERFGPGFFPLVLSGLLALFGLIIIFNSLYFEGEMPSVAGWYGSMMVVLSIFIFAFALEPLGVVAALLISVFVATLASARFRLITAILLTLSITLFCWAVFIVGLGQTMPVIGPWLGGH